MNMFDQAEYINQTSRVTSSTPIMRYRNCTVFKSVKISSPVSLLPKMGKALYKQNEKRDNHRTGPNMKNISIFRFDLIKVIIELNKKDAIMHKPKTCRVQFV